MCPTHCDLVRCPAAPPPCRAADLGARRIPTSSSGGGLSTAMRPVVLEIASASPARQMAFSSAVSRSTIGFGVPARRDDHSASDEKSKPGTPASARVGMVGHRAEPLGRRNPERTHLAGLPAAATPASAARTASAMWPRDEIVERRRIAAIGDVHQRCAGHASCSSSMLMMLRRTRPGRCHRTAARLRLAHLIDRPRCCAGTIGIHQQHERRVAGDGPDRRDMCCRPGS